MRLSASLSRLNRALWTLDSIFPQACSLLQLLLVVSLALNAAWIPASLWPSSIQLRAPSPEPMLVSENRTAAADMLKIGGQPCGNPQDEELVDYLRNIVLIINGNHDEAGINTGRIMREIYGRYFENVVVIGPQSIPEYGIEARGNDQLRQNWYFAYFHFPSIVARYPQAEGYLWLDDDSVLNYWTLRSANKSRFWIPNIRGCEVCQIFIPFNENMPEELWDGWSGEVSVRRGAMLAMSHCELKYIYQFRESLKPRKEGFQKKVVDIFYIPRRHAEIVAFDLIPVFRDHKVRSQVAIPMMFFAIDSPKEYELLFRRIEYRWRKGDDEDGALRYWNKTMTAYHPWRLTTEIREHSFHLLGQGDNCLLKFIPLLRNRTLFPPTNP